MAELVAVTGANGFTGSELVNRLSSEGSAARALLRKTGQEAHFGVEQYVIGDLNSVSDFGRAVSKATIIARLAARAYEMNEDYRRAYPLYERLNTQATLNRAGSRKIESAAIHLPEPCESKWGANTRQGIFGDGTWKICLDFLGEADPFLSRILPRSKKI